MSNQHLSDDLLDAELEKDLAVVVQIPVEVSKSLADEFLKAAVASIKSPWIEDSRERYLAILRSTLDRDRAEALDRFIKFTVSHASDRVRPTSATDLATELTRNFRALDQQQAEVLFSLVEAVFKLVEDSEFKRISALKSAEDFGPSRLIGVGYCVDGRLVPQTLFRPGDNAEAFEPTFAEVAVRGTITLILSQKNDERTVFQVARADLQFLIDALTALRRSMVAAESALKLTKRN